MIDRALLLSDLQKLLKKLHLDLREQATSRADLDAHLRSEYESARKAGRTAAAFEEFREEPLVQSAVAWVLGAVFVRFLEDNGLLDHAREPRRFLAGTTKELRTTAEAHYLDHIRAHPAHADDAYLLAVFDEVSRLPGGSFVFDRKHNALFALPLSADGAKLLRAFFREQDPQTGGLKRDFTDAEWATRFLGDLYQDLSEEAKKRYALLQTPQFVEGFILDRTLTPAIEEFGWEAVKLIDPACGSGHFLLGAFERLVELRRVNEPGLPSFEIASRALDQVFGVDLNPFAAAIARFRLLIAALKVAGLTRLQQAPVLRINVAVGDSLLHGRHPGRETADTQTTLSPEFALHHHYETEDAEDLARILGGRYHAVVANPPYITVKDAGLNALYRARFSTCYRGYSLVCPFMERLIDLCVQPADDQRHAGFVGVIASNAFMKREFGSKLVEEFLPKWDLTHVVDTSVVPLPSHGTATIILLVRGRQPAQTTVRAGMGIRGQKPTDDPRGGPAWEAIVRQMDLPGSQSDFVSVSDIERERLAKHPWSMGGGGAAELKVLIESSATERLGVISSEIGRTTVVGEDEIWIVDGATGRRQQMTDRLVPLCIGEAVRDWRIEDPPLVLYPYIALGGRPVSVDDRLVLHLWPFRELLKARTVFGKEMSRGTRPWWEHLEHYTDKLRTPLSITFAFVATHNHFVLDLGGKVFNRSAPVIKLPPTATEDDHIGLLGLLNSSTACFWMKQTFYCKGVGGVSEGSKLELWEPFFEHDGTKLQGFPLVAGRPLVVVRLLESLACQLSAMLPSAVLRGQFPNRIQLDATRDKSTSIRRRMIALQEELDWQAYKLYGLTDDELTLPSSEVPEIALGERAFEIFMARKMAAGELTTTWFERHGSIPITKIPAHWPVAYRAIVQRRLDAIASNPNIALIEKPEYKRRWASESWDEMEKRALRDWLCDRLERADMWPGEDGGPAVQTTTRLADRARKDPEFRLVAELYFGRPDVPFETLMRDLCLEEGIPYLAAFRYTDEGLRKRVLWENTWRLQRLEDAGEGVGPIPVPPKYDNKDFRNAGYWRHRGKLDVPKERFILYPGAEVAVDPSPVVGWAGWDHLQRARALAAYYVRFRDEVGPDPERRKALLTPLLAGLQELVPWLLQWHNEPSADLGEPMGTYMQAFVRDEARAIGATLEDLAAWKPESKPRGRAGRKPRRGAAPTGDTLALIGEEPR